MNGPDPLEVLRNAVSMEIEGQSYFKSAAERMTHPRAKETFGSLVKQEQRHVEILQGEIARLTAGESWASVDQMKSNSPSIPRVSVFQDKAVKRLRLDPNASELDVLKVGMEIEKKSMDYYREAAGQVADPKAKELFNWLVGEEGGHLTILNAEYQYRTSSGFYYDNPEFSLEVF